MALEPAPAIRNWHARIRGRLVGPYRDFTLLALGAALSWFGTCATQIMHSAELDRREAREERRAIQKEAALFVDSLHRLRDDITYRAGRVLELPNDASDSLYGRRIDEYETAVNAWLVAEPYLLARARLYFDSTTAKAFSLTRPAVVVQLEAFRARQRLRRDFRRFPDEGPVFDSALLRRSPPALRRRLEELDSTRLGRVQRLREQEDMMRRLAEEDRQISASHHTTMLQAVQAGIVALSPNERADLRARVAADRTWYSRAAYELGLYPLSLSFFFNLAGWAIFAYVCRRVALRQARSGAAWTIAGALFGPVALLFLLVRRRSDPAAALPP